jgi:hypothetical protein
LKIFKQKKVLNLSKLTEEEVFDLNSISLSIQSTFNDIVENFLYSIGNNLSMVLHPLFRRNPDQSDFFLHCCFLALIEKYYIDNKLPDTIIVPDKFLKDILVEFKIANGLSLDIFISNEKKKVNVFHRYKSLLRNIYLSFFYLTLANKKRKKTIKENKNSITIIDTFFIASMFQSGKFEDRYYNNILSVLSEEEQSNIYFTPTILGDIFNDIGLKKTISIANKSKEKFIFQFDFLTFSDYLIVLSIFFKIKKNKFENFNFLSFRLDTYLAYHYNLQKYDTSIFTALLNYRFIRRLKKNNIKLRHFIDWYENQPIDKAYSKAIREFYPSTTIYGYAGYYVAMDFHFYISPTEYEIQYNFIPDKIVAIGSKAVNSFKKFSNNIQVITAPAFRFNKSFNSNISISTFSHKKVLVTLPINSDAACEIIQMIIRVAYILENKGLTFHLLFHPSLDKELCLNNIGAIPPNTIEVVSGTFASHIFDSSLLITNNSSTAIEGLALGKPVIIIASRYGLTQNPIPATVDKKFWELVYTDLEFIESLNRFLLDESRVFSAKELLNQDFFELLTREGVLRLLNISKKNN